MIRHFDLFVIGGGSGGVRAARIAASHGARVAIADDHRWGGTCVVRGCIPKKLLVYASEVAAMVEDARGYGWDIAPPRHDWATLRAAKDREISRLSGLYLGNLRRAGVTIFEGRARLLDATTIDIAGERVTAEIVLVATGGAPRHLSIPGGDLAISSDQAFDLPELPRRVAVIGGGYIGVEFAGIFAGLGATVTLCHRGEAVLPGFDHDLRTELETSMRARGITLIANDEPRALSRTDGGVHIALASGAVEVDRVLAAIGRVPQTAGLGVAELGVALDPRGAIVVDEWSRSSLPNLYAVGDVTGHAALTPLAIRAGHAFADTVFGRQPTTVEYDRVPTAVFGQPPCAAIGLTEDAARARGTPVQIFTTRFRPLRHTVSGRDEKTFIKLVVDAETRRVLGLHMLGADAPEIVQAAAIAITMGATKEDFDRTVALHPTAAEELVLLR